MSKPKDMPVEQWRALERERKSNPEYKAAQAQRMRNWKDKPENIKRQTESARQRYHQSSDVKRRRADAKKKWASSPEGRAKRKEEAQRQTARRRLSREYEAFMAALMAESKALQSSLKNEAPF